MNKKLAALLMLSTVAITSDALAFRWFGRNNNACCPKPCAPASPKPCPPRRVCCKAPRVSCCPPRVNCCRQRFRCCPRPTKVCCPPKSVCASAPRVNCCPAPAPRPKACPPRRRCCGGIFNKWFANRCPRSVAAQQCCPAPAPAQPYYPTGPAQGTQYTSVSADYQPDQVIRDGNSHATAYEGTSTAGVAQGQYIGQPTAYDQVQYADQGLATQGQYAEQPVADAQAQYTDQSLAVQDQYAGQPANNLETQDNLDSQDFAANGNLAEEDFQDVFDTANK